eukprot:Sspe_Gene.55733::Locus_30656_Transcript_1_1_Confidence_1.000_Length_4402::g.55733::m.55733
MQDTDAERQVLLEEEAARDAVLREEVEAFEAFCLLEVRSHEAAEAERWAKELQAHEAQDRRILVNSEDLQRASARRVFEHVRMHLEHEYLFSTECAGRRMVVVEEAHEKVAIGCRAIAAIEGGGREGIAESERLHRPAARKIALLHAEAAEDSGRSGVVQAEMREREAVEFGTIGVVRRKEEAVREEGGGRRLLLADWMTGMAVLQACHARRGVHEGLAELGVAEAASRRGIVAREGLERSEVLEQWHRILTVYHEALARDALTAEAATALLPTRFEALTIAERSRRRGLAVTEEAQRTMLKLVLLDTLVELDLAEERAVVISDEEEGRRSIEKDMASTLPRVHAEEAQQRVRVLLVDTVDDEHAVRLVVEMSADVSFRRVELEELQGRGAAVRAVVAREEDEERVEMYQSFHRTKHTVAVQRLQDESIREYFDVVTEESFVRSRLTTRFGEERQRILVEMAVPRLQRFVRVQAARRRAGFVRQLHEQYNAIFDNNERRAHRHADAEMVQRFVHRKRAARTVAARIAERWKVSAEVIQRAVRVMVACRHATLLSRRREYLLQRRVKGEEQAAQQIQWTWRRHRAAVLAKAQMIAWKEERRRSAAARRIQPCWRGCAERAALWKFRVDRRWCAVMALQQAARAKLSMVVCAHAQTMAEGRRAVLVLQCFARGRVSSLVLSSRVVSHSAQRVQRAWRCNRARGCARKLELQRQLRQQGRIEHQAAVLLQTAWKGHVSRVRFAALRAAHQQWVLEAMEAERRRATLLLQAVGRGWRSRTRLRSRWCVMARAAVVLQCWTRCTLAKTAFLARAEQEAERRANEEAKDSIALHVGTVQRCVRGWLARGRAHRWRKQLEEEAKAKEAAVRVLQRVGRGFEVRDHVAEVRRRSHASSLSIQLCWRCYVARRAAADRAANRDREILRELQHTAALILQRNLRAHRRRRRGASYRIQEAWHRNRTRLRLKAEVRDSKRVMKRLLLAEIAREETDSRLELAKEQAAEARKMYIDWSDIAEVRAVIVARNSVPLGPVASQEMAKDERKERKVVTKKAIEGWAALITAERVARGEVVCKRLGVLLEREVHKEAVLRLRMERAAMAGLRELRLRVGRCHRTEHRRQRRWVAHEEELLARAAIEEEEDAVRDSEILRRHSVELARALHLAPRAVPPPPPPQQGRIGVSARAEELAQRCLARLRERERKFGAKKSPWVTGSILPSLSSRRTEGKELPISGLAAALRENKDLRAAASACRGSSHAAGLFATLDLSSVPLSDVKAVTLLAALIANETLISLRLENTGLGDMAAVALAESLRSNNTLTAVSLCNNPKITDVGANRLASCLQQNTAMRIIEMSGTSVTQPTQEAIRKILQGREPSLATTFPPRPLHETPPNPPLSRTWDGTADATRMDRFTGLPLPGIPAWGSPSLIGQP